MIKVTAHFAFEHHHEEVDFEFKDDATQEYINDEIEIDFQGWLSNYLDAGWNITKQEKVEQ